MKWIKDEECRGFVGHQFDKVTDFKNKHGHSRTLMRCSTCLAFTVTDPSRKVYENAMSEWAEYSDNDDGGIRI